MKTHLFVFAVLALGCSNLFADRYTPLIYQRGEIKWNHDLNRNRVDDRLEAEYERLSDTQKSEAVADVLVVLNTSLSNSDIEALFDDFGDVHYIGKYLSFVALKNAKYSRLDEIRALSQVAMIEKTHGVCLTADVSVAAIQVTESDYYVHSLEKYEPAQLRKKLRGKGVGIAIIDSGVRNQTGDPSFKGHVTLPNNRFSGGYDAKSNMEVDPDDVGGHGTHIASIALGAKHGNFRGVAPDANLIDMRVGDCTIQTVQALEKCIEMKEAWNIRVVNISLWIPGEHDNGLCFLAQACNFAVSQGLTVVVAAGNSGKNMISAPASADDVLAVGNVDDMSDVRRDNDEIYTTSSFGLRADDYDSSAIDECRPQLAAPGTAILAADYSSVDGLTTKLGTSCAAPHVSGLAAIVIGYENEINPLSVHHLLCETTDQSFPHWNNRWGYGMINAIKALDARTKASKSDVRFPDASTAWVSPAISTVAAPETGVANKIRIHIENDGDSVAKNVRLNVGVYDYGNGKRYYTIAQRSLDINPGMNTLLVDWTPVTSNSGKYLAQLYAEIGYGFDTDFENNVARRSLCIESKDSGTLNASDYLAARIENNAVGLNTVSVTATEVDAESGDYKDGSEIRELEMMQIALTSSDPSRTIPMELPPIDKAPNNDEGEFFRHVDFVVKASGNGVEKNLSGFRYIQSQGSGKPPQIDAKDDAKIVISDGGSGIAYVSVDVLTEGAAEVPPFVPGVKKLTIPVKLPEGQTTVRCRIQAWDCCLNKVSDEITVGVRAKAKLQ